MAKQNKTADVTSEKQRQLKSKPIVEEVTDELTRLTKLPGGPLAAVGDGSIEAQAARLGDKRFQTIQRQALAAQIGQMQGNLHLQKVVDLLKPEEDAQGDVQLCCSEDTEQVKKVALTEQSRTTGTSPRQVVQMSYDDFMRLPRPRGNLFQEIQNLNLADVNTILGQIGTPQQPGDLWQRIEGRYVSGTAQLVYDRLIEQRNQLQSGGQGEEGEQTREEATSEGEETEREEEVREDRTRVYREVPCTDWNMFLEAIRARIALRVMSRTPGPGGQPIQREVPLTEDNDSLLGTYEAIGAVHREEIDQGYEVFETVTAVFHYVNDRVESITFHLPQHEGEGEQSPAPRTLTVEFGVGDLTSQQLTSPDTNVFLRFARQFVLHVNFEHTYGNG